MPNLNHAGFKLFPHDVPPRKQAMRANKKDPVAAPYINKHWKRVMAVGCCHGELANQEIQAQVLAFKQRYKPEIRFELGDVVDTAAFRTGAKGTSDETKRPEPDEANALVWLERYEPTHITWGNHDARLVDLQSLPSAIVAYAASTMWKSLTGAAKKLHAKTRDYDFETGWFEIGGIYWGHGYWYNEAAVRDHAEYLGGSVVMAHLHRPQQTQGRTLRWSPSYCVGTLANIPKMAYARRRRATSQWGHGVVWGEVSDKAAHLNLTSCEKGESLRFPL